MKKRQKLKKAVAISLLVGCLCSITSLSVGAKTAATSNISDVKICSKTLISEETEFLHDGDYITTQVYEYSDTFQMNKQIKKAAAQNSSYEKTGTKTITYSDSNGRTLWTFMVQGTFKVTPGSSVTCTKVGAIPNIIDTTWSAYSITPSRSGNSGKCVIVMQKKSLGAVVKQVTKTVTVSCDKNGVIS